MQEQTQNERITYKFYDSIFREAENGKLPVKLDKIRYKLRKNSYLSMVILYSKGVAEVQGS
jgi:hypothetical protein